MAALVRTDTTATLVNANQASEVKLATNRLKKLGLNYISTRLYDVHFHQWMQCCLFDSSRMFKSLITDSLCRHCPKYRAEDMKYE